MLKEKKATKRVCSSMSKKSFVQMKEQKDNEVILTENCKSSSLIDRHNENKKDKDDHEDETIIKDTKNDDEKLENFDFIDDCGNGWCIYSIKLSVFIKFF